MRSAPSPPPPLLAEPNRTVPNPVRLRKQVLKGTNVSLWVRNMQLSTIGIMIGATFVWLKDGDEVAENGFFYG